MVPAIRQRKNAVDPNEKEEAHGHGLDGEKGVVNPPITKTTTTASSSSASKRVSTIQNHKQPRPRNRRCSYCHNEPPPIFYIVTSQRADAVLASIGAGLCLFILTWIRDRYNIASMGSFLLSASIKMFYNTRPPTLTAFWKSSAFCIPAGTILHFVVMNYIPEKYAQSMVVSVVLLYWKLNGEIWTAANSVAIYLAAGSGNWDFYGTNGKGSYPWSYLIAPYLSGHLFMHAFATVWSYLRIYVRAQLVQREFFTNEQLHLQKLYGSKQIQSKQQRLRDLFDRMDLDGNGRLDVQELQLAFRSALGCDITIEECEVIMKSTDTDGDSTLDFNEFCAAMDKMAWG